MKKLSIILTIIAVCFTSYIIGYNTVTTTTNLSLKIPDLSDETTDWFDTVNGNFELVDDIFDTVSLIEFSYLDTVSSNIQTQLDAKPDSDTDTTYTAGDFLTLTVADFDVDVKDEDDMASNSASYLATQQSIKAYVDAQGGGYTNLTSFVDQTAWRVFYSNTAGDVTELALGADGTFLGSNGAAAAPTFSVPGGGGDVVKVGTPADSQIGVWTGDGTIEGAASLTYDGSNLLLTGDIGKTDGKITKGWFTDMTVANAIAGDITGNAATVTSFTPASGSLTLAGADALTLTTTATTDVTLPTTGTLLANTVEDTTPELGGEMDAGAHSIGFTLQTDTGTGAKTIDWKLGNKMKFTFGAGNVVFTFTAPTNPCTLMLTMIQDATGSRTITLPATCKWPGGTEGTLTTTANARDKVALDWDGTQYDCQMANDFK